MHIRFRVVLSTQELLDEILRILRTAFLQDDLSVACRCVLVHEVHSLLELAEDVVANHFREQVGVEARAIVLGCDMAETEMGGIPGKRGKLL